MPPFDYKSMLTRYLKVVVENEGTDFLPDPDFTPEEISEMVRLQALPGAVSFRRKSVLPVLKEVPPAETMEQDSL